MLPSGRSVTTCTCSADHAVPRVPARGSRQPGGTPLGEQIRELVLHGDHVSSRAEALLFAADKAHHVDQLVKPALAEGRVVIT
ncbi:MAG: dTMP kinase, partial [Ralstonia sp.]|uniref:dTMP kinase n=1 Tax=Ralstonia sp. TaxID=54061 RepID=UPI003F7E1DE8